MYKQFLLWLMRTSFYKYLILHIIPYIRFSMYYTSIRGWKYQRGYVKLQKGDIILTRDKSKLTGLLISGIWSHAALCVDKGSEWEVSEMTHTNYTKSCFFDICKEADVVAIYRCRDWDPEYTEKVIEKCKTFQNEKYDITFTLGVEALYCSELVYQSDFERRSKFNVEDIAGLGRPYISPTGLSKIINYDLIWNSDFEKI